MRSCRCQTCVYRNVSRFDFYSKLSGPRSFRREAVTSRCSPIKRKRCVSERGLKMKRSEFKGGEYHRSKLSCGFTTARCNRFCSECERSSFMWSACSSFPYADTVYDSAACSSVCEQTTVLSSCGGTKRRLSGQKSVMYFWKVCVCVCAGVCWCVCFRVTFYVKDADWEN